MTMNDTEELLWRGDVDDKIDSEDDGDFVVELVKPTPPFGRRSIWLCYCFSFMCVGQAIAIVGSVLPMFQRSTGGSLVDLTYVFTARSVGYLLGSAVGGPLFERVNGNRFVAAASLVSGVITVAQPHISSVVVLGLVTAVHGLCMGFLDAGANLLICWVFKERASPYLQALHFAFALGAFLAPVMAGAELHGRGSIVISFSVCGALSVASAVLTATQPWPVEAADRRQQPAVRRSARFWALVGLGAGLLGLYVGGEVIAGSFYAEYAHKAGYQFDDSRAAFVPSVYWGALAAGRLLSIPLSVRLSPTALLVGSTVGSLGSALILLPLSGRSAPALWTNACLFGVFMAPVFPTTVSLVEQLTGGLSGAAGSVLMVGASTGEMLFPLLAARLIAGFGYVSFPASMTATSFFTVVIFLAILAVGRVKAQK